MGLPTEQICQKMLGDLDDGLSTLESAKNNVLGDINSAISSMESAIFTPIDELESAANNVLSQMESMVPDFGDVNVLSEISDMISACTHLETNYGDASGLLGSLTDTIFDGANDIMGSIFGAVPELDIANALNDLIGKATDFDLGNLVPGLDSIINCLSSVCGSDVSSRIDRMNGLMGDMNLGDDGSFDLDSIMDSAGLGDSAKAGLSNVTNTVGTVKQNITSSISNGISSVKSAASGRFNLL